MKTFKYLLIALLFLTISQYAKGQVTVDDNLPTLGNYVGFDNTSLITLPIRNDGFPEIDISSNGNNKFAISELPTWNGLNGLTRNNVQRTTMGLNGEADSAWSMLHLWSGALTPQMYRAWYNVGTSYTGNADFMCTGLLERPTGTGLRTDAVIAWGCQSFDPLADNFRFIFLVPNAKT
jgi:hypothetical protein